MIYVATVHYKSPQWIEVQTRYLRQTIGVPLQIWTSLEGIDPSYGSHFDRVLDQSGLHAPKLNELAAEIAAVAEPEDLIMFLDGDAFPIADPMPLIEEALSRAPLLAVRRDENFSEPQPHPCFCVTSVRTWQSLPGDWRAGPTWIGPRGKETSDVGARLMKALDDSGTPWVPVLRSNHHELDPMWFGIYGGVIYHHGAGFRTGELSPVNRAGAPRPLRGSSLPLIGAGMRMLGRRRWREWEQQAERRNAELSQRIYELIRTDAPDWESQIS